MINDMKASHIDVCEKFEWTKGCFAWTLMNDENLCVMQEKMAAHTQDDLHYHAKATQFIYILDGTLHLQIDNTLIALQPNQGMKIPVKIPHRVINQSNTEVNFILISAPGHSDDRVLL